MLFYHTVCAWRKEIEIEHLEWEMREIDRYDHPEPLPDYVMDEVRWLETEISMAESDLYYHRKHAKFKQACRDFVQFFKNMFE